MSISILGKGLVGSAVSKKLNALKVQHNIYGSDEFDLCNSETWMSLSENSSEVLITAGSMSNDRTVLENVNEKPIKQLCKFFKERNVSKVIFISSGAVYGEYPSFTSPELECFPSSIYGLSKYNAEKIFLKNWKGKLNIIRLYFTYGPSQKKPRLLPVLIDRILNGEPISINTDGGPIITLNHVEDVANNIIEKFILSDQKEIIMNLASTFNISIKQLAERLGVYLKKQPIFEIKSNNEVDHISKPYPVDSWPNSGNFEGIFQ